MWSSWGVSGQQPPFCTLCTLLWATSSPGARAGCTAVRIPKARVLPAAPCHSRGHGALADGSAVSLRPSRAGGAPTAGSRRPPPACSEKTPCWSSSQHAVPPLLKAQEDGFGVAPFSLCLYLLLISALFSHTSTLNSFGFSF